MHETNIDELPNPVIVYDEHWKIANLNRAALHFLNYDQEDALLNKEMACIFGENDLPELKDLQNTAGSQGYVFPQKPLHHLDKNGRTIKFLAQFAKSRTNGQTRYIESGFPLGSFLDWHLQELRALDCYKTLAENVPGLDMILIDKKMNIQCKVGSEGFHHGWAKIDPGAEKLQDFLSEEMMKVMKPLIKIAFEGTSVSREFEMGKYAYSARLIPLMSDTAEITCLIILQNITDTKLVEKQLKLSKEDAEEANAAKGNFIAKMSHEIRTPLNAIIGFSEQLGKTVLNKKQGSFLDVIQNSSQHLLSMIDDILILSRIDSEEIDIDTVPFRISKVIKAVNDVVEIKHKRKGIGYKSFFDLSHDHVVLGDPSKLRQVLINLVTNAIKFTEKGSVELRCTSVKKAPQTLTVLFEVKDSGIGIAKKDLEKILQPFHQVDSKVGATYSGTGLGLTISSDLIEKQGGELKIDSKPGKGSTFSFMLTFPKSKDQEFDAEDQPAEKTRMPLNHLHLLFVDDDPVNRMLGKVILDDFQAKTDYVSSGGEAIEKFQPGKYDLVLLDINMPGTNGVDVARHIRSEEAKKPKARKTKVVAMTANVLKKHIDMYFEVGMDDIVLKPFNEQKLYDKIVRLTSKRRHKKATERKIPTPPEHDGGFDLTKLKRITKGDQEFLVSMLDAFIVNSENMLGRIEKAIQYDDYPEVAEAVHRLIPSMKQLGLRKSTAVLLQIDEKFLRKESYRKDPELVSKGIAEIRSAIRSIKSARAEILNN